MSTTQITKADISEMIRHWLSTPPEGYLGSGYGSDVKSLLQRAQSDASAFREFTQKMFADLPVLGMLPEGTVTVYTTPDGTQTRKLVIDVAGDLVEV